MKGRKKKTHEKFIKEVYELVGTEYEIINEYTGNAKKIKIKHTICNNIYEISPNSFLQGHRCPYCNGNKNKTTEQFKQEVYNLVGDEYTILGEYINNKTKIRIKHNICGEEYEITPNGFLKGHRCICQSIKLNDSRRKKEEQFIQEIYNAVGDEYTIIDKYNNATTKIHIRHNCEKCNNHEYLIVPNEFLRGYARCPKCFSRTKTHDEFCKEIKDKYNDEYKILGEYKNIETHVLVRHNHCGYEWNSVPSNLLRGYGCPICRSSKGERKIYQYLKNNKIYNKRQYTFNDLIGISNGLLKYDFAIIDNKILKLLIEYDGIFHFEKQFDGDGSEIIQYHDKLKNAYCEKNNIDLLRIPYWDYDNIEQILDRELNMNSSQECVN
jgi:hypothetical protein